jgi:hypothetical protein
MLSLLARPAGSIRRLPVPLLLLLLLVTGLPACASDKMARPVPYRADQARPSASAPAASAKPAAEAAPAVSEAPPPPTRGTPVFASPSNFSVAKVAECVSLGVAHFKVPANFIHRVEYSDGSTSVYLSPPGQDKSGPEIAIAPQGDGSLISLYNNGMVLSGQWRALVLNCASGVQPSLWKPTHKASHKRLRKRKKKHHVR